MDYSIDFTKYNIQRGIKYLLFIVILHIIIYIDFRHINNEKMTNTNKILLLCVMITILFVLLDSYYPACKI
jgi:hypothetical protein